MSNLLEEIKHSVDATIPEVEDLSHMTHPKIDYTLLILRNVFVLAAAYLFECLAATDCFKTKVEHHEMFMVYCFGPLYLLMGLNYILWH